MRSATAVYVFINKLLDDYYLYIECQAKRSLELEQIDSTFHRETNDYLDELVNIKEMKEAFNDGWWIPK